MRKCFGAQVDGVECALTYAISAYALLQNVIIWFCISSANSRTQPVQGQHPRRTCCAPPSSIELYQQNEDTRTSTTRTCVNHLDVFSWQLHLKHLFPFFVSFFFKFYFIFVENRLRGDAPEWNGISRGSISWARIPTMIEQKRQ